MKKVPNISSCFSAGGTDEIFFALCSSTDKDFISEAEGLMELYKSVQTENGCSEDSEVMLRFHLSDATAQIQALNNVIGERNSFVSFIGQQPAHGSRLALEAYHIKTVNKLKKKIIDEGTSHEFDLKLKNYELFLHCLRKLQPGNSFQQADEECQTLNKALTARKGTFMDNCLRTWFYVRDIDNNYAGVVDARREYFRTIGMTEKTHYVSSTGIEGQCADPKRLVDVDALCMFGLDNSQIEFMHALDHMPPTHLYNVTFERGTRVIYGDRSHFYISGTASIDEKGNVAHPGDVRAQTRRMVENVDVLLQNHGGSMGDMKIAVVYLRNSADASAVESELEKLIPSTLPRIVVTAPVCRPGWLVEMEGIAVNKQGDEKFKPFA